MNNNKLITRMPRELGNIKKLEAVQKEQERLLFRSMFDNMDTNDRRLVPSFWISDDPHHPTSSMDE